MSIIYILVPIAILFGAVNVRAELKKMIAWCDANPRKRKTKQLANS